MEKQLHEIIINGGAYKTYDLHEFMLAYVEYGKSNTKEAQDGEYKKDVLGEELTLKEATAINKRNEALKKLHDVQVTESEESNAGFPVDGIKKNKKTF